MAFSLFWDTVPELYPKTNYMVIFSNFSISLLDLKYSWFQDLGLSPGGKIVIKCLKIVKFVVNLKKNLLGFYDPYLMGDYIQDIDFC